MSGESDIYLCNACRHHAEANDWQPFMGETKERNCILCGARPAPYAFVASRVQVKDLIKRLGDERPKPPA